MRSNSLGPDNVNTGTAAQSGRAEASATGKQNSHFSNKYHLVSELVDPLTIPVIFSLHKHHRLSFAHPVHLLCPLGELQYSPAVLQQRLAAELHYFESIEESVRQLGDMERLMGVSMAQHESASLAQMLQVKEHDSERNIFDDDYKPKVFYPKYTQFCCSINKLCRIKCSVVNIKKRFMLVFKFQ